MDFKMGWMTHTLSLKQTLQHIWGHLRLVFSLRNHPTKILCTNLTGRRELTSNIVVSESSDKCAYNFMTLIQCWKNSLKRNTSCVIFISRHGTLSQSLVHGKILSILHKSDSNHYSPWSKRWCSSNHCLSPTTPPPFVQTPLSCNRFNQPSNS